MRYFSLSRAFDFKTRVFYWQVFCLRDRDPTSFNKKSDYLKKIIYWGQCHDLYSLFSLIISCFFFRNTASGTWNSSFEIFMQYEIKVKNRLLVNVVSVKQSTKEWAIKCFSYLLAIFNMQKYTLASSRPRAYSNMFLKCRQSQPQNFYKVYTVSYTHLTLPTKA